jgi:5-methylcytosine-specific restriction endonuclease McrA
VARSRYQNGGRWIRADRRLAIYLRDGFRCLVCMEELEGKPGQLTLDHVVGRKLGGSHHEKNLYTCCRSCNSQRQDRPLKTWLEERWPPTTWGTWAQGWMTAANALQRIRRHRRRKLDRYRQQAKEILSS